MKKALLVKSFTIFPLFIMHQFIGFDVWTDNGKIKQVDLDHDGKIAIKEAVADPELLASFGKIDTDGLITQLELEKANYAEQKVNRLTKTN
jgi:hypothetical protein